VHQDDLLEALVDVRVLDDAEERRQPRARAEQVQALSGQEIVGDPASGAADAR